MDGTKTDSTNPSASKDGAQQNGSPIGTLSFGKALVKLGRQTILKESCLQKRMEVS